MSAMSLYRSMGLKGYGVEEVWEAKNVRCLCGCRCRVSRESCGVSRAVSESCGVGVVGVATFICMNIVCGFGRPRRWV